jgi:hypothetical protein
MRVASNNSYQCTKSYNNLHYLVTASFDTNAPVARRTELIVRTLRLLNRVKFVPKYAKVLK